MKKGRIEIVSTTTGAIVPVADVKAFCYIDGDADDTLLTSMETAAREKAEAYLRRPLLPQSTIVWFDRCIAGTISTPFGKLNSVTDIKTYDEDDASTVTPTSDYVVDTATDQYGRILFNQYQYNTRKLNTIGVTIVNGFADVDAVPQLIKEGMKSLIAFWFENREMYNSSDIPADVKTKWNPYRIVRL